MEQKIKWAVNGISEKNKKVSTNFLSQKEIQKVKNFHESFPEYSLTPLRNLEKLSYYLGVAGIYVKDESYRFGLNAFKVLGGSFAMANYLAQRLGKDIRQLDYNALVSDETRKQLGEITFATTTDGNHGRGVAWTANRLKQKSVVYMPKGSSITRLNNIKAEGAEAYITELNYDDAVRLTSANAKKNGWIVVQDTAWEGYEEIPAWIMQGYGTMAAEALAQIQEMKVEKPTHIFIQAGVGSLAGAVQGYFASVFGENRPKTIIVESDQADCLYQSILKNDGNPHAVTGDLNTIMAGLACGEPNTISWEIVRDYSDMFVSCPDWVAARGMRILGNPIKGDCQVISGESGAVTAGLLATIMTNEKMKEIRNAFDLNENSRVLLFSTEGDTDPEKYREIVWDGGFPVIK